MRHAACLPKHVRYGIQALTAQHEGPVLLQQQDAQHQIKPRAARVPQYKPRRPKHQGAAAAAPAAGAAAAPARQARREVNQPEEAIIHDLGALSALFRLALSAYRPPQPLARVRPAPSAGLSCHFRPYKPLQKGWHDAGLHENLGQIPISSGWTQPALQTLLPACLHYSRWPSAVRAVDQVCMHACMHAGNKPPTAVEAAAIELIKASLLAAERSGEASMEQRGHLAGRFTDQQLARAYEFLCEREQLYAGGISRAYGLTDAFKASLQVPILVLPLHDIRCILSMWCDGSSWTPVLTWQHARMPPGGGH